MKSFIVLTLLTISSYCFSQTITPDIYAWYLNLSGTTGYNSLPANIQSVKYSNDYVYINCSGIPSYTIGPWPNNPNQASNQNFLFKIARSPQVNNSTKTATPLGHIGVLCNGVALFNAKDAASYNNQDVWHQNAVVVEAPSMDNCLGHPQQQGEYHHHQNPKCLYTALSSVHSPLLGFAFDGFPIYGAYAYANTNGSGGITRMKTSYRKRTITTRTLLPDGSTASHAGPAVSGTYPVGYYIEDYEYVSNLGDLDAYNGRFAVTPEYPNGTYAYYATIDSAGNTAYPYFIGPAYYGIVIAGNTGVGGGHGTISEAVTTFRGVIAYDAADTTNEDENTSITVTTISSTGLSPVYAVIDSPNHGTLTGTLPTVTYHPESGYYGTDNFLYTITASTAKDTGSINVTILEVADTLGTGQFHVNNQWNLVSLSMVVNDSLKTSLFPTAISNAFAFHNSYVAKDTLTNGTGYWLKFNAGQTITLSGTTLTDDTVTVYTGWNLIGSLSDSIQTASITTLPSNIISSGFYGYENGYMQTTTLFPGKGYWVKVNNDGVLILSSH